MKAKFFMTNLQRLVQFERIELSKSIWRLCKSLGAEITSLASIFVQLNARFKKTHLHRLRLKGCHLELFSVQLGSELQQALRLLTASIQVRGPFLKDPMDTEI